MDIKNVKEFGAKGDGKTDDTVAIQEAVNAACISGTGLYFPSGMYTIHEPIFMPIDFKLRFENEK